ncbi:MAG TPA: hypothetical protein DDW52_30430 [Planctomycetaceae bacterium]|nr:hypothetical protein [Planctomycetaceae bacterium]
MPAPTSSLITLRPELATFEALDSEMNTRGYIATRLMPPHEVGMASGTYSAVTLKSLLAHADADTKRSNTGGYNRGDYEFEERTFKTERSGWEERVDERELAMYTDFFDLEDMARMRAWEVVLNRLEAEVIDSTVNASVTAARTNAAGALWTDLVNATPLDDVQVACEAVWARTGLWPNVMGISRKTFKYLRRCVQVLNAIKSDGAGDSALQERVSASMVAEALGLEEVVISDAIQNTANRAKTPVVASRFPDDKAWISVRSISRDVKQPQYGRILHWGGDGSEISDSDERLIGVVESYEEPQTSSQWIRVRHDVDHHVQYPEAGQVITGVA